MVGLTVQCQVGRGLRRFLRCRRGTAEIVGSVMFLLIMLFFFTNVFLWHDNATREMDDVVSDKMNSLISVEVIEMNVSKPADCRLEVTNNGGVGVTLSRLWISGTLKSKEALHSYFDLSTWIDAGIAMPLLLDPTFIDDFSGTVTFKVVTTRGNIAACSIEPYT